MKHRFVCIMLLFGASTLSAQQSITIYPSAFEIRATDILKGDGDTYGLGNFVVKTTLYLKNEWLTVRVDLKFAENANDFTTIVGSVQYMYKIDEIAKCRSCVHTLAHEQASTVHKNIGARGYKVFGGDEIVESLYFITDTFGEDAGNIGGTVQLAPITIYVAGPFVQLYEQKSIWNDTCKP
jgi:hypothetical protein